MTFKYLILQLNLYIFQLIFSTKGNLTIIIQNFMKHIENYLNNFLFLFKFHICFYKTNVPFVITAFSFNSRALRNLFTIQMHDYARTFNGFV